MIDGDRRCFCVDAHGLAETIDRLVSSADPCSERWGKLGPGPPSAFLVQWLSWLRGPRCRHDAFVPRRLAIKPNAWRRRVPQFELDWRRKRAPAGWTVVVTSQGADHLLGCGGVRWWLKNQYSRWSLNQFFPDWRWRWFPRRLPSNQRWNSAESVKKAWPGRAPAPDGRPA